MELLGKIMNNRPQTNHKHGKVLAGDRSKMRTWKNPKRGLLLLTLLMVGILLRDYIFILPKAIWVTMRVVLASPNYEGLQNDGQAVVNALFSAHKGNGCFPKSLEAIDVTLRCTKIEQWNYEATKDSANFYLSIYTGKGRQTLVGRSKDGYIIHWELTQID
jgi:hypothetical protein